MFDDYEYILNGTEFKLESDVIEQICSGVKKVQLVKHNVGLGNYLCIYYCNDSYPPDPDKNDHFVIIKSHINTHYLNFSENILFNLTKEEIDRYIRLRTFVEAIHKLKEVINDKSNTTWDKLLIENFN